jgi:uncharacterized protein (TIGR03067 family)
MRKLAALTLVVLLAGLLPGAPAPKEKDDKELIQGVWKVVSADLGGRRQPEAQYASWRFVFTADKLVIKVEDRVNAEYGLKLDPSQKPKTIDIRHQGGGDARTELGIYELDGDNLKICNDDPGLNRPSEFVSTAENGFELWILKRVKP